MDDTERLRSEFDINGFVVVPRLLPEEDVRGYTERMLQLADGRARWTEPDGINRHPEFWGLIVNARLLEVTRQILGSSVCYLPHNDLHVGFSSFSWHRDNVNREVGQGPDWDETHEPYRLARVGIYLQRFAESRFRLGLIPGSHRAAPPNVASARSVHRRTSAVANVFSGLSGVDLVGTHAEWVAAEAGDAVIFDPRILHTGSKFHGTKYSMFIGYGVPNSHFRRHWHYYVNLRKDLGYSGIGPDLEARLSAAGLYADPPPADLVVEHAWMPSPAYTYVAQQFKS